MMNSTVNDFIRNVIIQAKVSSYTADGHTIKYKLDNEFDLIFLIVYQSVVQLAYADKLLTEVHMRFRDLYKNKLRNFESILIGGPMVFNSFNVEYLTILANIKSSMALMDSKKPRSFQESEKSRKTVASLIENPKGNKQNVKNTELTNVKEDNQHLKDQPYDSSKETGEDEEILRNKNAFIQKMMGKGSKSKVASKETEKTTTASKKRGKQERKWELAGTDKDAQVLDYSAEPTSEEKAAQGTNGLESTKIFDENKKFVGMLKGNVPDLDVWKMADDNLEDDLEKEKNVGSWFSAFKSLVGTKQLNREDIEPVLETMREMLITKNVASEPAEKICDSVGTKLEGKVIGTFNRVTSIVRESIREALVQLLTPKRRVDILRDIVDAKSNNRPYVIVFCGVNGVGKSTNLAKITFWLNENGHRVLIAAGDTFRAGAVEQLRTHAHHLNALHPQGVQLFEQGYGKDPASIAQAAIQLAVERKFDVVLVDTAGRMQDNEPLMRALSKLINVNDPDLVLFVGEALVGNEAVDQLVKFNQALSDHSAVGGKVRLIDGIVLTKFDTIDDKVGAAISMTYITGQPIVFVGTGQTYHDLRSLNVNAVVKSLLK